MIIQQDDEHVYQDESVLDIPTEENIDEQVEHMVVGNQVNYLIIFIYYYSIDRV